MTEKQQDLKKGVRALWELCEAAADGDEQAQLALQTLNNMQSARNQALRAEGEVVALRTVTKALTQQI